MLNGYELSTWSGPFGVAHCSTCVSEHAPAERAPSLHAGLTAWNSPSLNHLQRTQPVNRASSCNYLAIQSSSISRLTTYRDDSNGTGSCCARCTQEQGSDQEREHEQAAMWDRDEMVWKVSAKSEGEGRMTGGALVWMGGCLAKRAPARQPIRRWNATTSFVLDAIRSLFQACVVVSLLRRLIDHTLNYRPSQRGVPEPCLGKGR